MKRSKQDIVGSDSSRNQRARIENGNGGGEVRRVENPPANPVDLPAALSQLGQGHLVAADPEGSSSSTSSNAVQPAVGNHGMALSASAPVPTLPWAGGDESRVPAHLMPHRKPKNFADRLMRVLLNGSAPDTLWWVGDGKAVAVHARNLKRGSLLDSYFKVKDYNAFIRNCNRWGFSKTNQYVVPDGVKVYQCSLFQRDAPHLMLHMRIDSDVQDVFMRHVDLEDQEKKKSSARRGGSGQGTENGARASSSTNGGGNGAQGNFQNPMLPMAQQSGNTNQAPQAALQNNFQNSMPPLNEATQATNITQDSTQDMIQTLMRLVGNGTAAQPTPAPSGEVTIDSLLDQIMSVSDQYMRRVANEPPSEINQPIQTLMQLLQIHIRKYKEHRAEQERQKQQQQQQQQQGGTNMGAVEPLLRELLRAQFQSNSAQSTQGTQQRQAPQQQQQGNFGGMAPATPMNQQMQPAPAAYYSPVAGPQQVPQGAMGNEYQHQQDPSRQTSSSTAAASQPANTGGQGASSQQNAQNALSQFLMQFMQQNGQGGNGATS